LAFGRGRLLLVGAPDRVVNDHLQARVGTVESPLQLPISKLRSRIPPPT
jgi:hypothetical protein